MGRRQTGLMSAGGPVRTGGLGRVTGVSFPRSPASDVGP